MAIPILNHLNVKGNLTLNDYKLQDFVVDHSTEGDAGNTAGKLIYDSGTLKYYDGSSWQSLGTSTGDITRVNITAGNGLSGTTVDTTSGDHTQTLTVGAGDGITVNSGDVAVTAAQTTITSVLNTSLKVGRSASTEYIDFATDNIIKLIANGGEARWNGSAFVPGSDGDKDLGSSSKEWNDLYIDGTANIDALAMGVTVTAINDEDDMSSDSATALATQQSIKAYVDGKTYDNVSIANLKTKLAGGFGSNAVTIGDSDDVVTIGNNLVVTGDLTVSGDTITANVGTLDVEDKNITVNKGSGDTSSTADGAGLTIQDAVNASTDATMLWDATNDEFDFSHPINVTGKVTATGTSVFASLDISGDVDVDGTLETDALSLNGTSVSSTATELNYLDGTTLGTVVASKAVAVDSNKDITGFRNVTLTGELDAATGDFSGNVDVDGTLEADAITVNGTALNTVIDNRIKVVQKTATVDVSSLVNNVFKCNIAHGMNSNNLIVKLYDGTTYLDVFADIDRTDANTLQITFSHEPTNDIVVVIQEIIGDNIAAGSDITYPSS